MARVITNLIIDQQPLRDWLDQPNTTIIIVIGNGQGALEARAQISYILGSQSAGNYVNVEFGFTTNAKTIKPDLLRKKITGFEDYALISISPESKKLITNVLDNDLIGLPGWIQQAIIEALNAKL